MNLTVSWSISKILFFLIVEIKRSKTDQYQKVFPKEKDQTRIFPAVTMTLSDLIVGLVLQVVHHYEATCKTQLW